MIEAKFQNLMRSIENNFSGSNCRYSDEQIQDMFATYQRAEGQGYINEHSFTHAVQDWCAFQEWQPNISQLIQAANQLCKSRPGDFGLQTTANLNNQMEYQPRTGGRMPDHVAATFNQLRAEVERKKAEEEKARKEREKELHDPSVVTGMGKRARKPMTKEEIRIKHQEMIQDYCKRHYYPDGTKRRGECVRSETMVLAGKPITVNTFEDGSTVVHGLRVPDPSDNTQTTSAAGAN